MLAGGNTQEEKEQIFDMEHENTETKSVLDPTLNPKGWN